MISVDTQNNVPSSPQLDFPYMSTLIHMRDLCNGGNVGAIDPHGSQMIGGNCLTYATKSRLINGKN